MKAVMYHYVQEYNHQLPYFNFLDIFDFRKQLDYFENNFGFILKKDWNKFINGQSSSDLGDKVLLTFDDGLKCHYSFVFDELVKRGLWGIFYVSTGVIDNNEILDVHKIHILTGTIDGKSLLKAINDSITEDMIPDYKIRDFREKTYKKHDDSNAIIDFKRILNYYVDYEYRSLLITKIANKFNLDFNNYNNYYLKSQDIKNMSDNGMLFGAHTKFHPLMSKLNQLDQEYEIIESKNKIKSLTNQDTISYCHPYGGFHSFNDITVNLLRKHDIKYSFNVESRNLELNDIFNNIQSLPRYDCNEFPNGKIYNYRY